MKIPKKKKYTVPIIWAVVVVCTVLGLNDVSGANIIVPMLGGLAFWLTFMDVRIHNKKVEAREKAAMEEELKKAAAMQQERKKSGYGEEVDAILEEGDRALREMARLYTSINDNEVKLKINELMRVTDKIVQDAIEDPSDIPQIKKFMNYYLPTTIKLLNSYDRMGSHGITGDNISKSMDRITEMLDVAIDAYKKRLDSLYANNALDIDTDIDVLNQMLERDGLTGGKDFEAKTTVDVGQVQMKL